MAQSLLRRYPPIPKWRDERDQLVREVHGNFFDIVELELPDNKVSSKEKCIKKKLKTWEQLDDQKFNDFLLGCEGFNSVSFQYNKDLLAWEFVRENFSVPDEKYTNNNGDSFFNEYDKFAGDLLTKIHNIKRYMNQFQNNYQLGRCVAILVDEINKFMNKDFKNHLKTLRDKPDASKTILQAIYLEFNEPIGQLETFLISIVSLCAIGGFLLNMIKKERDSSDKCYQNFFHDILTRSYRRGMEFYMQLVTDWLNNNNLDNDPFFEFFIWDAGKQRCSNVVNKVEPTMIGFDETILLGSVELSKFYSPIDVKSFKNQYLIVPELCPRDFDEELRNGIIRIGLYNHVLMLENQEFFNAELNATPVERLNFDNFYKLHTMVKNRHFHSGRVVLRHLCNQLEFTILMEKLPAYFCGIRNAIIDDFVELTENFNWSDLSTHKNARLIQLNRLYQRAIEQSPLANDPLAKMILLEFSVPGQVDVSHPPTTNYSNLDRPLTDLELTVRCKDSFGMAFPPTVFELYRNLFRLKHTLRRTYMLLKRRHFEFCHELSRVELNALSLMIRFVQGYDNFVFGYKAPKLVHEYLELVKSGISTETLDLDTFLKKQEHMIGKLHNAAFVSGNSESFSNPMWAILSRFVSYARNESDLNSTCIEVGRLLKRIKRYLKSQYESGEKMPELSDWVVLDSFERILIRDKGF